MIAIKFSPIYEDRVGIYLKNSGLKKLGVEWDFKSTPGIESDEFCYWLINYKHAKLVNAVLSEIKELKQIMGVSDLSFQYCYNEKEFYTQTNSFNYRSIEWFKV